jgi:hypothetical protein
MDDFPQFENDPFHGTGLVLLIGVLSILFVVGVLVFLMVSTY